MTDLPPQGPAAGQPQQPYSAPTPAAPLTAAEDRQWAMWSHIGGVLGPIPPLIIWLIFKDRGALTNQEGKEALNFQITIFLAQVVNFILGLILTAVTLGLWFFVQTLIGWAIAIVGIVFAIIAGVKVNGGGTYRYPFAVRFIK
jgi:uncharacterized Tic20 family protein